MKRILTIVLVVLVLFGFVACDGNGVGSNGSQGGTKKAFSVGSQSADTLQGAVDLLTNKSVKAATEANTIKLNWSVTDVGADIDTATVGEVKIDFGSFTYTLANSSKGINIQSGLIEIAGGKIITGEGNTVQSVIKSAGTVVFKNTKVDVSDNETINAVEVSSGNFEVVGTAEIKSSENKNAITAKGGIVRVDSNNAKVDGGLTLEGEAKVHLSKGTINITKAEKSEGAIITKSESGVTINFKEGTSAEEDLGEIQVLTFSTDWTTDETHHWHVATSDPTIISDKAEHSFGAWVIDTEATVDSSGTKHGTCYICDYVENRIIERITDAEAKKQAALEYTFEFCETVFDELYPTVSCLLQSKNPEEIQEELSGEGFTVIVTQNSISISGPVYEESQEIGTASIALSGLYIDNDYTVGEFSSVYRLNNSSSDYARISGTFRIIPLIVEEEIVSYVGNITFDSVLYDGQYYTDDANSTISRLISPLSNPDSLIGKWVCTYDYGDGEELVFNSDGSFALNDIAGSEIISSEGTWSLTSDSLIISLLDRPINMRYSQYDGESELNYLYLLIEDDSLTVKFTPNNVDEFEVKETYTYSDGVYTRPDNYVYSTGNPIEHVLTFNGSELIWSETAVGKTCSDVLERAWIIDSEGAGNEYTYRMHSPHNENLTLTANRGFITESIIPLDSELFYKQ